MIELKARVIKKNTKELILSFGEREDFLYNIFVIPIDKNQPLDAITKLKKELNKYVMHKTIMDIFDEDYTFFDIKDFARSFLFFLGKENPEWIARPSVPLYSNEYEYWLESIWLN